MSPLGGKAAKQLLTAGLLVLAVFAVTSHHALAYSDDYPSKWKGPMDSTLDDWGYYNRECTSFVAWRLHDRNGFEMPRAIGNAANWGTWATSHGYMVDMNQNVGAVAWFGNHVAWVESVSGSSITIEEYNHSFDGTYSERIVPANSVNGYIHFKDLGGSSSPGGASGLSFVGSDILEVNQMLKPNQYILSEDVRFFLVMQDDGNLVLYGPGPRAYWASNTVGSGAAIAIMQSDGNLVLYTAGGRAVWASNTGGREMSSLYMQSDGNLVVYSGMGPTWASNTGGHAYWRLYSSPLLNNNQTVGLSQYIRSANKEYAVALQDDGNLVLYGPGYHVLWHASTGGKGVASAIMQSDGNLVLYRSDSRAVWASSTGGKGNSFAIMQDDGNFVIYNWNQQATWASGTGGQI